MAALVAIHDIMSTLCPKCECYMSCTHLFSPSMQCPYNEIRQYVKSMNKEESEMNEHEKRKIIDMTEGMSEEELRLVLAHTPTKLLHQELGMRLEHQEKFIDKILQVTAEYTSEG